MIDLHCHSTASDGTDSPTELVRNAVAAGLTTMAITDHDTTGGWAEAAAAVRALSTDFTLIRGTEFSCVYVGPDGGSTPLHLLGYLFNPDDDGLKAERARLRQSRLGRGEAIVQALVAAGYPISWQQVTDLAAGGAVGRPHIGQALQQAGVVSSVNEAFSELLSSSSPYYVAKQDSPVLETIASITRAGGVAVIAHPWARSRGAVLDESGLAELVSAGMAGIEVDHLDHSAADRLRLREFAAAHGLFCTGSSDYHGSHKAVRLAAETTSQESLEQLLKLAHGVLPVQSTDIR